MGDRRQSGGQNRGASLIQVVIAIVFVLTMGSIVTEITWTNIRMREVELSGKKNFYSAEAVVDDLTSGLNDSAAAAMQEAYTTILADYRSTLVGGGDVQKQFTRRYLDQLAEHFQSAAPGKDTITPSADGEAFGGYYNVDILKDGMAESANQVYIKTDEDKATFLGDYEAGTFTLRNVEVDYTDDRGYETSISTDMVFHTPDLNFKGSYRVTDYMKYGLVADDMIKIDVPGVTLNGNIYAGAGGIRCMESTGATAQISGSNIVTRGDILAGNGTTMTVGDGRSRIWAENVGTVGTGTPSALTLNGDCYIADDLMINGSGSKVNLMGNYYGYNFQEKYDGLASPVNADFSSAIMINGEGSALDLSGLSYLLLAGRTYISRGGSGSSNQDILLGESLSVRTNQLAYSVPEEFLDRTYAADGSVVSAVFSSSGLTQYADRIGMANVTDYLSASNPIAIYYYREGSLEKARYYLNFADEQKANDFFTAYWSVNNGQLSKYAESYADAIVVDSSTLYTLKGDMLWKNFGEGFTQRGITIEPDDWQQGVGGTPDGIYWEFADQLAVNYKALEMYLEDSHTGVDSANVRFDDGAGGIDKTAEPLFENLLDTGKIKADYPQTGISKREEETVAADGIRRLTAVVNNEGQSPYIVANRYGAGVVIATGDVHVEGNFKGMIISGGTVTFSTGASVASDELLLSDLFQEDAVRPDADGDGNPDSIFATYFKNYSGNPESVIGEVHIDEYLSYENWTKNEE